MTSGLRNRSTDYSRSTVDLHVLVYFLVSSGTTFLLYALSDARCLWRCIDRRLVLLHHIHHQQRLPVSTALLIDTNDLKIRDLFFCFFYSRKSILTLHLNIKCIDFHLIDVRWFSLMFAGFAWFSACFSLVFSLLGRLHCPDAPRPATQEGPSRGVVHNHKQEVTVNLHLRLVRGTPQKGK